MVISLFTLIALSVRFLLKKHETSANINQTRLAFDGQSGDCGCGGCGCGGGGK